MTQYYAKIALAALLLAAGFTAFLSMMARLGRPGDEARSERLRRLHKKAGWTFVVLLAPLVVLGADFLAEAGEGLTTRAVFHFALAAALVAAALIKVLIVKAYRQQLKHAQALGLTLFGLTLVTFLITAAYFVVVKLFAE